MIFRNALRLILVLFIISNITACSTLAPIYQPDFSAVATAKGASLKPIRVDSVTMDNQKLEKLSIRGGQMTSPHGGTYVGYFKYALEEQLRQANLLNSSATTAISCVVQKNDLDGSGMSVGTADLAGKFVVTKEGSELYNKVISIHHEWPSSFVGAVAIPNAQIGYMNAVQKLMASFFNDPEFVAAAQK